MKRNLILAAVTALLFLAAVGGCWLVMHMPGGMVAVIRQDGKEVYRVDLSQVETPYTMSFSDGAGGENVVLIEPGAISMQSANCPDGLCMQMGTIRTGGLPVVCLPHHIMIEIEGSTPDAPDVQAY